jgi:NADH-quinone oxidoreductase subunit C
MDTRQVAPEALLDTVRKLKAEAFDLLLDVTAVDWPCAELRFEVVYHFYSTTTFHRVRVKTRVPESQPLVDSLVDLYGAALFVERECHEMYGIQFRGHPDLRPILLYEGFEGHPLRKDYPIGRDQPLVKFRK